MLLASLVAVVISGCSQVAVGSSYRVLIPLLQANPITVNCATGSFQGECVLLLKSDYEAIVRELKAACLANGQTAEECQTN